MEETPLWVKMAVMILLCAQNSLYALLRRYSQIMMEDKASASSMLLVGEFIKIGVALVIIFMDPRQSGVTSDHHSFVKTLRGLVMESVPLLVPAIVYLAMNLLSFVALERIDAGLFTVCAQAKVLTTAVCSVLFLSRKLSATQWRALLLLVFGAILISDQTKPVGSLANADSFRFWIGLAAVILEISLSGFVSVYFEKVLKGSKLTVWDRNVQLAIWSIFIYYPLAWSSGPIFQGWKPVTWVVALLGAFGGILVAMTLKYMDAIVKCFATSGAIVVTTFAGHVWLDARLNLAISIGACLVILSMFNYNEPQQRVATVLPTTAKPEPSK